ncbi:radical SAM protein [Candidatus Woesearchaeota archaeon]|nr:radical SAM protein [Candidatus Woesearchaeota archaeon]
MKQKKQYTDPPMLRGWRLSTAERQQYLKKKLLGMIYAGTSNMCDLGCIYCQTRGGKQLHNETNLKERKKILNQAKALGCKFVHLAGAGEPTIDPLFWHQLGYINKLGMTSVVFTHGMHIDEEKAKRLYNLGSSVIVKIHSKNPELQDYFANRKGYTKKRENAINYFIKVGFNKETPTRLGIDVLVTKKNIKEIPEIFIWARENNIFPEIKPILFLERASQQEIKKMLEVKPNEIKELYYKLLEIDQKKYGYSWNPAPPYAGFSCDYYYYHLLISCQGDIKPCIGFEKKLGNIRTHTLRECWEHPFMDKIRNIKQNLKGKCGDCEEDCYGCPCRRIIRQGEDALFQTNDCFTDNM